MPTAKVFNGSKRATGCLVLFALPFFAVGASTTWSCWRIALRHSETQSWVETPAVIKDVVLKVDHGGEDTTYQVVADYDYQFACRAFQGERVSIHGGSDSIGSFQRDAYKELKQYADRKQPFRCFVNPNQPSEAVLYRELRSEMVVFKTLFATTFGAMGLGLMTAVIAATRRAPTLKTDAPADKPWASRTDWEAGLIPARTGSNVAITTIVAVAVYWCIASLPLVWKLPGILARSGVVWGCAALAFPLIAVLLTSIATYLVIRQRKFGQSTLLLASTPAVIGGQLAGVVRSQRPVMATDGFRIVLHCLDWVPSSDGHSEKSVWQDEQRVIEPMRGDGEGTAIPVLFAIPYDCRETSESGDQSGVHWRLDISAKLPGVDYSASFDVPVFKTPESRPDFKLDEGLAAQVAPPPDPDLVLRQAGIIKQPLNNGVRLEFCMARNLGTAIGVTIVLAILCAVVWAMYASAPILLTIVVGLFTLLMVYAALDAWFYRSVAEASPIGLTLRGGLFGISRARVIPVENIRDFTLKESMSSGTTVWHNVLVLLRDSKEQSVARSINGKLVTRAVIEELKTALQLAPGTASSSE